MTEKAEKIKVKLLELGYEPRHSIDVREIEIQSKSVLGERLSYPDAWQIAEELRAEGFLKPERRLGRRTSDEDYRISKHWWNTHSEETTKCGQI